MPRENTDKLKQRMTAKQRRFAEALVLGGMTQAQAYREVYAIKGSSKKGQRNNASTTARSTGVQLAIKELERERDKRIWADKGKFRNWIMQGITDTANNTESDITRLKALELAGRTVYASVFEEPNANETNQAVGDSIVSLIGARLQSLLGHGTPNIGDCMTLDTVVDPMPSHQGDALEDPTGGGEGE